MTDIVMHSLRNGGDRGIKHSTSKILKNDNHYQKIRFAMLRSRPVQPQQIAIALVTLVTLSLGGCATTQETSKTTDSDAQLRVVSTFLPITQFTQAVAGDRAEVVQLLPQNVDPHDYQAKPTDVQAIAQADVLVQNGFGFEFFLEDLIKNAENSDLVVIDTSEDIEGLANADIHDEESEHHDEHEEHHHDEEHGDHKEHEHDEHDHDAHGHDEEHGDHKDHKDHEKSEHGKSAHDEQGHDGHDHGPIDPHVWLDPKLAIAQVEEIRDGLIAADPEGEAEYTANAAAYIDQLEELDTEIREKLEPYAGQTFVSLHDFATYFAQSYGLEAEFLLDIPDETPSPEDVRRIIEVVEAADLKALLTEPQGQAAFEAIAKDLGIGVSVFDPMEIGGADSAEPDYYLDTMRQNAENIEVALSGTE